jgi:hypothetical protein
MEDDLDRLKRKNNKILEDEEDHVERMKMLLEIDKSPKSKNNDIYPMDTIESNYNFVVDDSIVDAVVEFGYPRQYILKSLENNEANY